MKRLLAAALLLTLVVSATATARVGSIRNPLAVYENTPGVDNFGAAIIGMPGPFADGRNRLFVSQSYAPFPLGTRVYVSRAGTDVFTPVNDWNVTGLGCGSYLLAATLPGEQDEARRHWSWGPTVVRFRRKAGERFYVRLWVSQKP
mgnify:CR=1 FL=1